MYCLGFGFHVNLTLMQSVYHCLGFPIMQQVQCKFIFIVYFAYDSLLLEPNANIATN